MAISDETSPTSQGAPNGGDPLSDEDTVDASLEARPSGRLVFPTAGCGLLYAQDLPMEYMDLQPVFPIPNTHALFRGLLNRRGNLVPVYDIRELIESPSTSVHENRILVLGAGENAVGIMLDGTPYRAFVSDDERADAPQFLSDVFGRHLVECYKSDETWLVDVALDDFLYELIHEHETGHEIVRAGEIS